MLESAEQTADERIALGVAPASSGVRSVAPTFRGMRNAAVVKKSASGGTSEYTDFSVPAIPPFRTQSSRSDTTARDIPFNSTSDRGQATARDRRHNVRAARSAALATAAVPPPPPTLSSASERAATAAALEQVRVTEARNAEPFSLLQQMVSLKTAETSGGTALPGLHLSTARETALLNDTSVGALAPPEMRAVATASSPRHRGDRPQQSVPLAASPPVVAVSAPVAAPTAAAAPATKTAAASVAAAAAAAVRPAAAAGTQLPLAHS